MRGIKTPHWGPPIPHCTKYYMHVESSQNVSMVQDFLEYLEIDTTVTR
jgi:hypothetical protein